MRTKNVMQLKAKINNRAREAGISPAHAMQAYVLDRLILRISKSPYRDSIIVKGGVLIGSLIGVDRRTTMDLDTTISGFTLTLGQTCETASEILSELVGCARGLEPAAAIGSRPA